MHTHARLFCRVFTSLLSPRSPPLAASLVQAGLIRTDSTDYFIEPFERGQQEAEAGGRKHVVYRREVVRQRWTEPLGDLHNEGRLWSEVPGLPPSTSQGCFQVTSGLGFSTPGLSLLTGVMALGHIDLLHQQETALCFRGYDSRLECRPEELPESPEHRSLSLGVAQRCFARLFLCQDRRWNDCS